MTITATSVDLSWAAPVGGGPATAYDVLYRVSEPGPYTICGNTAATSYTVNGLAPSTTYDFAVYARNSAGPGPLSGVVTAATLGAVPNAPGSFAAAAGSPAYNAVNLTWTAPGTDSTHGTAASYTVSYRLNDSGAWTVAQSGIVGLSATITGLQHAALYGFKVDAVNSAGTNVAGATTTRTTDYAPPNVPTISSVAPVPDGTTSKLAVTWSAPVTDSTHDAATGYDLQYSVSGVGSWTAVTGGTSPATITGLSAGTSYDVQVRAKNGSSSSPSAWSGSTTAGTYSTGLTFGTLAPTSPVSHSGSWTGGGLNFVAGTTPPAGSVGWFAYSTTPAPVPTTGLYGPISGGTGGGGYGSSGFGYYLSPPATAGTWYVFAILKNSAGMVIGALVSSAITVT